jgi:hypothetical protein
VLCDLGSEFLRKTAQSHGFLRQEHGLNRPPTGRPRRWHAQSRRRDDSFSFDDLIDIGLLADLLLWIDTEVAVHRVDPFRQGRKLVTGRKV